MLQRYAATSLFGAAARTDRGRARPSKQRRAAMMATNGISRVPKSRAQTTGPGANSSPRQAASQFSKGSVVSLHMKNFLVYKDVVAVFGPRLNVVVGPNGSGKSTLVCAIALGLGGSPKVRIWNTFVCCVLGLFLCVQMLDSALQHTANRRLLWDRLGGRGVGVVACGFVCTAAVLVARVRTVCTCWQC